MKEGMHVTKFVSHITSSPSDFRKTLVFVSAPQHMKRLSLPEPAYHRFLLSVRVLQVLLMIIRILQVSSLCLSKYYRFSISLSTYYTLIPCVCPQFAVFPLFSVRMSQFSSFYVTALYRLSPSVRIDWWHLAANTTPDKNKPIELLTAINYDANSKDNSVHMLHCLHQ